MNGVIGHRLSLKVCTTWPTFSNPQFCCCEVEGLLATIWWPSAGCLRGGMGMVFGGQIRCGKYTALAAAVLLLLVMPATSTQAAPATLLDGRGAKQADVASETFLAPNQAYDSEAADDFVVPAGSTWTLTEVEVTGSSTGSSRYGTSFRVRVYNSSGSTPGGTVLLDRTSVATGSGGSYVLPLSNAPALPAGTYWLSVQSVVGSAPGSQWYWNRTTGAEVDFFRVWRNPGGGYGTNCTSFSSACFGSGGPDLSFRLVGDEGAISGQPVPSFVGTIPLPAGTQVLGIGASARFNKVFAADDNSGNLLILDTASDQLVAQVPVGGTVFDVAVSDKQGRVFVASNTDSATTGLNPGTGLISVIDAATNQLITTINLYAPGQPVFNTSMTMHLDELHDKLYVMFRNSFAPGVATINTGTNALTVLTNSPQNLVSSFPSSLNRQTQEFVIGNTRDHQLAFVNGATNSTTLFNLDPTGAATPLDVAVNEIENKIYVTMLKVPNQGEIGVMILDRDTMAYSFVGKDDIEPLAFNPRTNRLFAGVQVGSQGAVIDGATDQFFPVPIPGAGIGNIAVREASDYAYMTSGGRIVALHGGTRFVWSLPVALDGDFGNPLAINQRTGRVYVARYGTQPALVVLQDPAPSNTAAGDFDGNGTTDIAVYRPSSGVWYMRDGVITGWGANADVPVVLPEAVGHVFFPSLFP